MNTICTFWVNGRKLGTICSFPSGSESIYVLFPEKICDKKVDIQPLEGKAIDEPLRRLSTNKYIIIMEKHLISGDQMYQIVGSMPTMCQWMAIPVLHEKEVVEYESGNPALDKVFLIEGYARELAEAQAILIPPTWDLGSCIPADLLIKEVRDEIPIPFNQIGNNQ